MSDDDQDYLEQLDDYNALLTPEILEPGSSLLEEGSTGPAKILEDVYGEEAPRLLVHLSLRPLKEAPVKKNLLRMARKARLHHMAKRQNLIRMAKRYSVPIATNPSLV